jgi:hypothetical protein
LIENRAYLVASSADFLDALIVEVVPVRDLNLSAESRVDKLDSDLAEGRVDIQNTGHFDGMDGV